MAALQVGRIAHQDLVARVDQRAVTSSRAAEAPAVTTMRSGERVTPCWVA